MNASDPMFDAKWQARIRAAIENPARFHHPLTGEGIMDQRARAVANALVYDDEQLRGMGLLGPPPTFTRAREADEVVNWRGPWDAETLYDRYDGVTHGAESYVAVHENSGFPPAPGGTQWRLVGASRFDPPFTTPKLDIVGYPVEPHPLLIATAIVASVAFIIAVVAVFT